MKSTKADVIFKDFWRVNEHFADLFNTVVFHGKEILKPEILEEMDTDVSGVIEMKDYKETLSRTRDVIKKTAYGVEFVVLGIENQQHIHYAMPLRHMIYDAMGYLKEYQEITRNYKGSNIKLSDSDEFLSRMRKEDRMHPIITLTIYTGEKVWDGPCSLKDMIVEMPEEIAAVFSDYKMNLLEVRDSAGYVFRNEDVQSAFEITREVFAGNFDGIREKYSDKRISSEALSLIGQMAGSTELIEMGKSMEATNMCTALERLKAEGVEQGIEQGIEQGMEKGVEKTVISMLKKNYPISEICEITGKTEEEILKIKEIL